MMPKRDEFEQVVARILDGGGEPALTNLARTLGAALPHRDLRRLTALARQCRRASEGNDHAEALMALSNLVTTYVTEVGAQQKKIDVDLLAERPTLLAVMECLADGTDRPSGIAEKANTTRPTVTKALAELRRLGLAEETNPPSGDRRQRPHQLTQTGHDALASAQARRVVPPVDQVVALNENLRAAITGKRVGRTTDVEFGVTASTVTRLPVARPLRASNRG